MMKFRLLLMMLVALLLLPVEGRPQSGRAKLIGLAGNYTSDGGEILRRVGDFDFEQYLAGPDSASLLEAFGTVVHESCHQLNHLIATDNRDPYRQHQGYFITKGIDIVAEQGPVFNSTKLNNFVPKDLQTKIFRYKTYIGTPQKSLVSQEGGIYGLVDEFTAYYQGTKACFELYDFYYKYRCKGYQKPAEWANYIQQVASSYFAWYEFRLFIAWYLEYAKKNYREVYESSMDNTPLRLAFTLIDNQFGSLVADFNGTLESLAAKLTTGSVKAEVADYENERSFIITTRQSATRTGSQIISIFSNRIKLLEQLLEGEPNAMLDSFRLKGAGLDNYRSFLKDTP
jgi:hypothetical protein